MARRQPMIAAADVPPGVGYAEARTRARLDFRYAPEAVDIIRALPGARFHAPENFQRYWTISRPETTERAAAVLAALRVIGAASVAFGAAEDAARAVRIAARRDAVEARQREVEARSDRAARRADAADRRALRGLHDPDFRELVLSGEFGEGAEVRVPGQRLLEPRRRLQIGDLINLPGIGGVVAISALGKPWREARADRKASVLGGTARPVPLVRWAYWRWPTPAELTVRRAAALDAALDRNSDALARLAMGELTS